MGSNADRPPTPVSKSSVRGSQSSSHQEPSSTLLQEKLQRERRSEIQRNLNRLASDMNSPAADPQITTTTPVRCATADGRRPDSSDTNGESGKKKGLALKEMEQVLIAPFFLSSSHSILPCAADQHILDFSTSSLSSCLMSSLPALGLHLTLALVADDMHRILWSELLTSSCTGDVNAAQTEL